MDLGADRRGVDMGPSAIRYAKLKESLEKAGIAGERSRQSRRARSRSRRRAEMQNAKYLPIIQDVCRELAGVVEEIVRAGSFPLVLGGDHSIAIGTLAGVRRGRGAAPGRDLGRRARRHQHAAQFAQRQRARDARALCARRTQRGARADGLHRLARRRRRRKTHHQSVGRARVHDVRHRSLGDGTRDRRGLGNRRPGARLAARQL